VQRAASHPGVLGNSSLSVFGRPVRLVSEVGSPDMSLSMRLLYFAVSLERSFFHDSVEPSWCWSLLVSRWLICAHWRPKTSHPAPHHAAVHLRPAACRRTFRSVGVVAEGAGPPGHHLFGCGQARTLLMAVPPGAVVVIAVAVVIVVVGFGGPLFEHGHTVPPKLINSLRSLQGDRADV